MSKVKVHAGVRCLTHTAMFGCDVMTKVFISQLQNIFQFSVNNFHMTVAKFIKNFITNITVDIGKHCTISPYSIQYR